MKTFVSLSKIHGNGLFAGVKFKKDDLIGTFRGRRARRNGNYILWANDGPYYITNKLRYANHSNKPNSVLYDNMELYATKNIAKYKEITFHYGEDWK